MRQEYGRAAQRSGLFGEAHPLGHAHVELQDVSWIHVWFATAAKCRPPGGRGRSIGRVI